MRCVTLPPVSMPRITARLLVPLLFAAALVGAPRTVTAKRPALRTYIVQPGDSCWSIAAQVLGDGRKYTVIHRYNDLGPMPHLLSPGQELLLPADVAEPEARVRAPRHDVKARRPATPRWREAYEDMALWRLFRVATGDDSSALIRFRDDSALRMREQALLVIHGASSKRSRLRKRVKTVVELEKGTLRGGLARLDREAGFTIATPAAEVDLRATSAQIEVGPELSSTVCIYEGEADVSAEGATVTVPEDFGTSVDKGAKPRRPRRLPAAPQWSDGLQTASVLVPRGFSGAFEGSWEPIAQAKRYRFELAHDKRFRQIVVDAVVGAGVLRFRAEDLSPGDYFARVAAIGERRMEGRPSSVLRLRVGTLDGSRRLERGDDGVYEVVGLLRLSPPSDMAGALEVQVDDEPFMAASRATELTAAGVHTLRYRSADSPYLSTLTVRVLGVRAHIDAPTTALIPGGAAIPITLSLTDEHGRPAALPGLTLTATPGGPLALEPQAPGRFGATLALPATADGRTIALAASWPLGALVQIELPVRTTTRTPQGPAPFTWPDAPPALEWARPAPGSASRAARPVTYLGLSGVLAEAPAWLAHADDADRSLFLRMALRGALSFLDDRFAADIDLPWYDTDLDRRADSPSDLGDIRLGFRYVALDDVAGVTLSPSLRVSLPTGHFGSLSAQPGLRDDTLFELGAIVEWTHADWLTLGSNQVFVVDTDFSAPAGLLYASSYSLSLRPWTLVSIAAELDALIGLTGPSHVVGLRALALGGAIRLHFDRFRLGLQGGAGLGDDGENTYGRFTVGVTLDLGFPGL